MDVGDRVRFIGDGDDAGAFPDLVGLTGTVTATTLKIAKAYEYGWDEVDDVLTVELDDGTEVQAHVSKFGEVSDDEH